MRVKAPASLVTSKRHGVPPPTRGSLSNCHRRRGAHPSVATAPPLLQPKAHVGNTIKIREGELCPPQNTKCSRRGGGPRLIDEFLGPGEWGRGRRGQAPHTGTVGLTAGLWDSWEKNPVKHTGPAIIPSDKAFEQGPPTFLPEHGASLFPQDGGVEGRWPEAGGSGSQKGGGHTPQKEREH